MRWSLLVVLLITAVIEPFLYLDIGITHLPLTLILIFVCVNTGWLRLYEAFVFGVISSYLLDILGTIYSGAVLVSFIVSVGVFVLIVKKIRNSYLAVAISGLCYSILTVGLNGLNVLTHFSQLLLMSLVTYGLYVLVIITVSLIEKRI